VLCATGAEARGVVRHRVFEVAVLDVLLPDSDWLDLLNLAARDAVPPGTC